MGGRKIVHNNTPLNINIDAETAKDANKIIEILTSAMNAQGLKALPDEATIAGAFGKFKTYQTIKGSSEKTIVFYQNCYSNYCSFIEEELNSTPETCPLKILEQELYLQRYIGWIQARGVNEQTVNSYLRGLRTFGNFCKKRNYIKDFHCHISEKLPPIKDVYTDKELERLMKRPPIEDFVSFRSYCIISLLLNTGARSETIRNLKIKDIDFENGYINFNTLKNKSVVTLALFPRTQQDLADWVQYWHYDVETPSTKDSYLFCSQYGGGQLTRGGLSQSVARYNRSRGVEKTSLHLFRHTFAKTWIMNGGDIITLSKVLTHQELDMVKRYSNLYGTDTKEKIMTYSPISKMKQTNGITLKTRKKRQHK